MAEKGFPAIRVSGLTKSFGDSVILQDVDIDIQKGEIVVIIGSSGCGKSVFLRLLEMLETPDRGQILINGEDIAAKGADIDRIRRGIGMVFQNFFLFTHLNVMDNLCLAPVKLLGMDRKEAEQKALKLLDMVGLASRADRMPDELSGGQKQRVAIIRSLMMDPEILLFDEPTSALDPSMVGEVQATIRMLAKRGLTMVIVTHEFDFAKEIATRVVFLAEKGIYEQGSPREIFENPQRELTVAFIRKIKSISEHIESTGFDLMELHGKVYNFGERYGYSQALCHRLQICTEELVYEFIRHRYPDWRSAADGDLPVDIDLLIEFSEQDRSLITECRATGPEYDLFAAVEDADPDHLGVVIIKKVAKHYYREYEDGRNLVHIEM